MTLDDAICRISTIGKGPKYPVQSLGTQSVRHSDNTGLKTVAQLN